MNIVWFGRDLRVLDHLPLYLASGYGETLPLYILEPSQWKNGTLSARHLTFVQESLASLSESLESLGGRIYIAIGEATDVFRMLREEYGPFRLFFYKDDLVTSPAQIASLDSSGIEYKEIYPAEDQFNQKVPKKAWLNMMKEQEEITPRQIKLPANLPGWLHQSTEKLKSFPVKGEPIRFGQAGGEQNALETLDTFLDNRFLHYRKGEESPLKASQYSSRLSPYLTWGNISLKTVVMRTLEAEEKCVAKDEKIQLQLFLDKLHKRFLLSGTIPTWEDTGDVLAVYRKKADSSQIKHIVREITGIPIIDASMVCLRKTGWLPESLRSLLIVFYCNTLLLDPAWISEQLASNSLDYDPSIHEVLVRDVLVGKRYRKFIDPVKAGKRIDKTGSFIKRFLPELVSLSPSYIHEPWLYPGFYKLGYSVPIIDPKKAARQTKKLLDNEDGEATGKVKDKEDQLSFDL